MLITLEQTRPLFKKFLKFKFLFNVVKKKWQDYTEPGDDLDPGSPLRRTSRNLDDESVDNLPLPEGVLTTNLGLDVVVVITKTDYMTTLEKEHDYRSFFLLSNFTHFHHFMCFTKPLSLQLSETSTLTLCSNGLGNFACSMVQVFFTRLLKKIKIAICCTNI